jgi:hypothetical protein
MSQSNPVRAAIYVYNADGSNGRLFARGLRNAEGLAMIPGTNTLWVVVNNRDDIAYPFNDGSGNYGRVFSGMSTTTRLTSSRASATAATMAGRSATRIPTHRAGSWTCRSTGITR